MTNDEVRQWLDARWAEVLAENPDDSPLATDQFIDSTVVSIRYAALTQLLGKLAEPKRDLLCLQKGDADEEDEAGRWDPRSFCTSVVVPWVQKNSAILGTSADPYVSKPLRAPRLDSPVKRQKKAEWYAFTTFLLRIEQADDVEVVQSAVIACLRSIVKRARNSTIDYPVPMRVSIEDLRQLTAKYLNSPSNGLRPLVVAASLLRILGRAFALFAHVESQGLNESDSATGMPGDVMCYDVEDKLLLAVEVKDRALTLVDFDNTLAKAQNTQTSRLLFAVPGLLGQDTEQIQAKVVSEWARGVDIHHMTLDELMHSAFVLASQEWRLEFIREVYQELDSRGAEYVHRKAWADLMR